MQSVSGETIASTYDLATGDVVNVTSPEYPKFHPDNLDMTVYFKSNENGSYVINIHEMALVIVAGYYIDYFTIGIGSNSSSTEAVLLQKSTFISPGTTVVIGELTSWIRLQTGSKYRNKGFSLEVKRISESGTVLFVYNCGNVYKYILTQKTKR